MNKEELGDWTVLYHNADTKRTTVDPGVRVWRCLLCGVSGWISTSHTISSNAEVESLNIQARALLKHNMQQRAALPCSGNINVRILDGFE